MSEDVPNYLPTFYSEEWHEVTGRGRVAVVRLDRERDDEGISELARSVVIIDGVRYQCRGVERFTHASPWRKDENVGLLVHAL